MVLGTIKKQPSEVLDRYVEFDAAMAVAGEEVADATVTCTDDAGNDVTSTIIDSKGVSGTLVAFRVKAGTDGETYTIRVLATTDLGQVLEAEVALMVEET